MICFLSRYSRILMIFLVVQSFNIMAYERRDISELPAEQQLVARGLSRMLLYEPIYDDPAFFDYILHLNPYIDREISDYIGNTPLQKAKELGKDDIVRILQREERVPRRESTEEELDQWIKRFQESEQEASLSSQEAIEDLEGLEQKLKEERGQEGEHEQSEEASAEGEGIAELEALEHELQQEREEEALQKAQVPSVPSEELEEQEPSSTEGEGIADLEALEQELKQEREEEHKQKEEAEAEPIQESSKEAVQEEPMPELPAPQPPRTFSFTSTQDAQKELIQSLERAQQTRDALDKSILFYQERLKKISPEKGEKIKRIQKLADMVINARTEQAYQASRDVRTIRDTIEQQFGPATLKRMIEEWAGATVPAQLIQRIKGKTAVQERMPLTINEAVAKIKEEQDKAEKKIVDIHNDIIDMPRRVTSLKNDHESLKKNLTKLERTLYEKRVSGVPLSSLESLREDIADARGALLNLEKIIGQADAEAKRLDAAYQEEESARHFYKRILDMAQALQKALNENEGDLIGLIEDDLMGEKKKVLQDIQNDINASLSTREILDRNKLSLLDSLLIIAGTEQARKKGGELSLRVRTAQERMKADVMLQEQQQKKLDAGKAWGLEKNPERKSVLWKGVEEASFAEKVTSRVAGILRELETIESQTKSFTDIKEAIRKIKERLAKEMQDSVSAEDADALQNVIEWIERVVENWPQLQEGALKEAESGLSDLDTLLDELEQEKKVRGQEAGKEGTGKVVQIGLQEPDKPRTELNPEGAYGTREEKSQAQILRERAAIASKRGGRRGRRQKEQTVLPDEASQATES